MQHLFPARLFAWFFIIAVIAAPALADNPPANFPPPSEWDQPSGAPSAPGDAYTVSFGTASPAATAPVISEWNRIAKPNETFTLTGIRFTRRTGTDAGSDTTVWLYAWNGTAGVMKQCKIWKMYSDYLIMACIPSDVPFGQYIVWVENQDGVSSPVCINKTQAEWLGPLGPYAQAGDTKRVFGKNLSNGHGTTSSNVYIQPAAGGAFVPCAVTNVEPCAVTFTVPAGTVNGSYKVYIHDGHGGRYGWSQGFDLTVQSAWTRGTGVVNVSPSGGNDTSALQTAINTVSGYTGGGTVQLATGTYNCTGALTVKNNVRLAGAGRSSTTIIFTAGSIELSNAGANHLAVQDMTVMPAVGSSSGILSRSVSGGSYNNDVLVRNVDFLCNSDTSSSLSTYFMVDRLEVDNCKWQGPLTGDGRDWWLHNNTLNGGRAATDGCMALLQGTSTPHGRYVIEYNAASTPAWPNQGGDRNYWDYMSQAQWNQLIWCARLIYFQMGTDSYECSYISHNTTQDVAIDDNKGETILFHSSEAYKYAQVASNSGRTLTIRTDGTIDGATGFTADAGAYPPMTTVPDAIVWGNSTINGMAYVQICYGTGIGQIRKILSHTSSTITVDSDWRVPPASDSRIQINYINRNHLQYQNTLNAMPTGFVYKHHCASNAVNYDGGCFGCVAEGNVSNRTFYGDTLQGHVGAPSYFNEMRGDQNYSQLSTGSSICARTNYTWYQAVGNVVGPITVGCYIRGATEQKGMSASSVSDVLTSNTRHLIGNAVEGATVTNGGLASGDMDDTLFRNNSFTYTGTKVTMQGGSQVNLLGNTYSGTGTKYSGTVSFKDKPAPEYRVAHFVGTVGQTFSNQTIPIANLGIQNCVWSITSSTPSWVTAAVASGGTVSPEAETGSLRVSISTTGLTAGTYWGKVNLTTTNSNVFTVGVEVQLSAAAGPAPEIDVQGNAISIPDNSTSPSPADGSDFGTLGTGSTIDHTFTVANQGTAALNLSGSPQVVVSGTNAADFTVTAQPSSPVAAAGSTTFTVRFAPSSTGLRTASISIANDDSDENPYNFAVQGVGYVPQPDIDVKGGGITIPDGDLVPGTADGTDFGSVTASGLFVEHTFTIANVGTSALNLTGSPVVSISGANASEFTVTAQPTSPVAISGNTAFTVRFTPTALGLRTVSVSIASNDPDENPYNFTIQGTGTIPTTTAVKINCGGAAVSDWAADAGVMGGTTVSTTDAIDTSGVTGAGPQQVYQAARVGECTYTITGLAAFTDYKVRLHFAEITGAAAGARKFSAKINGNLVMTDYDISGAVGGDKVVIREFTATADSNGVIGLQFLKGSTGTDPLVSGVEIAASGSTGPPGYGMKLWLKADSGVTQDGSGLVYLWADQSGSGNDVTQSNPTYRPGYAQNVVNGRPAVRFGGGDEVLQTGSTVLSGGGAFTTFAVSRFLSIPGGNYQYLWWCGIDAPTGGYGQWLNLSNSLRCGWGGSSYAVTSPTPATIGDWYRTTTRYTTGSHEMWVNGTYIGSSAKGDSNLSAGFTVGNYAASGAYQGFYGDIAELLVYNRKLSDAEKTTVELYLSSRWAPPSSVSEDRISQAKALDSGTPVSLTSAKVVTVASGIFSDGSYYIGEPDRSCGMKVVGGTAALWENITLTGTVEADAAGEKFIRLRSTDSRVAGTELGPLGVGNKYLSACGNLVRVWGRILDKTSAYFTVDDGGGYPVRIDTSKLVTALTVTAQPGDYVAVTGLAGQGPTGPIVQPRDDSDVILIAN